MRLAIYAGASTAAAAACLLKAFHQRPNFYSAAVYLSQSNACLLILTNLCLVLACGFMFALQRLLYGPLRPIEIEQLSEKAWYAVLDTLLAMPSFREDVGGWLLTMFVLLLAGKVWGWIGEGRVDILEQQPPANPRLFHARLSTSLVLSVLFDIYMLVYCIDTVLADPRPGMMVIFTFEFAILSIFSLFTLLRYGLIVTETVITRKQTKEAIEVRKSEIRAERAAAATAARENEAEDESATAEDEPIEVDEQEVDVPGWEDKRRYLFMLEALTDFIKLFIYLFFFMVSVTFNGLPMHIMRDVYMTFASFSKRVTDYVAYRKATSDMNTRYPDATTEEIRGDACIVCRESMVAWNSPNDAANADVPANVPGEPAPVAPVAARRRDEGLRAKKLPCGHILHLRCLKAWLERQQVCPTCRRPVVSITETATGPAPNQDGQGQQGGQQPPQQQQEQQQPPHPQQQQQRPARANRARIFNLGPIRVGLLNAPNGQLQNIVDQLRDPNARNQNAPGPGNEQAGDAVTTQQGTTSRPGPSHGVRGARASVPTQIQLMQIEQRLIQEAHNLGIEQQQLGTLRMMEAELARLRAHHIPNQAPVGVQRPQPQAPTLPNFPPEVLMGNAASQASAGADTLPDGLVLPPGWTIMPLHRVGGDIQAHNDVTHATPDAGVSVAVGNATAGHASGTTNTLSAETTSNTGSSTVPAPSDQSTAQQAGPTDDSGSPLFIPSVGTRETPTTTENEPPANESSLKSNDEGAKSPWNANGGWSFNDSNTEENKPSNEPEHRYSGKGKGKAVEVEDAPDADADAAS